ncbi:MAG: hypothetical protein QF464_11615 [Myxococcota bacterium]|jgi:uncharacterized membrane protein|nr:hypothetical protein [Myxococcota bacterium]
MTSPASVSGRVQDAPSRPDLWGVLGALLTLAYPLAVYVGLTTWSTRTVVIALLVLVVPSLVLRLRRYEGANLAELLWMPAGIVLLLLCSWVLDDHRLVLALPVLINLVMFVGFATTLRRGLPVAERFARMQVDDLSEAEVRYCRQVTVTWCGFFVLNGGITAALAIAAPLDWWALYVGLLSYVAVGTLFTVEYLVRSYRFRRYGEGLAARIVSRVLPPR